MIAMKKSYETKLQAEQQKVLETESMSSQLVKKSHEEEIERIKAEHAAAIDQQHSNTTDTEQVQTDKLEVLKQELMSTHQIEMEQIMAQSDIRLQQAADEAATEMERIRAEADERVSEAIKQNQENANATASESEKISALQEDFAIKMSEMQQSHQQELEKVRAGQSTASEQIEEMQARHALISENFNAQHEEAIQNVRNEAAAEKDEAVNTFKAKVQEKMAQVKESYEAKIVA